MQLANVKRRAGYLLWMLGEQLAGTGVTRFVLFPVAAYLVGKENFGVFVTALSAVSILGITPSMGLSTGLLRHMAEYPEAQRASVCRTAMTMCHVAMLVIIGVGLLSVAAVGLIGSTPMEVVVCLVPLAFSLYAENQLSLALTDLRITRKFRQRTLWVSLQAGLVLAGGLVGALAAGVIGLAWGFAIGNMVAYIAQRPLRSAWSKQPYDREIARVLRAVWLHMTVAGMLAFSGPYLIRIILSIWHPFTEVSYLYGATSVFSIFLVPVSCTGYVLLSLLAAYTSLSGLSRQAKLQCVVFIVGSVVGMPILMKVTGPVILRIMFPQFGPPSAELLAIVVWAMPFAVLMFMTRPFMVKFAPIKVIPIVNGLTAAGYAVPALLLIPTLGARGAAWSFVIGSAVYALAILAALLIVAKSKGRETATNPAFSGG